MNSDLSSHVQGKFVRAWPGRPERLVGKRSASKGLVIFFLKIKENKPLSRSYFPSNRSLAPLFANWCNFLCAFFFFLFFLKEKQRHKGKLPMAKRGQPHHIFSSQHLFSFSFYPKGKKKEDVAGKRKLVGLGQLALQKRREKPHSAEIISLFGGCGFSYSFSSANGRLGNDFEVENKEENLSGKL